MKQIIIRFVANKKAGITVLSAVSILVLIVSAALVIDYGRAVIVKHKAHQGMDAAALAAASVPNNGFWTEAEIKQMARRYFSYNFPDNYMGSGITSADVVINITDPDGDGLIRAQATLSKPISTVFGQVFDAESITIFDESTADATAFSIYNMDIVLVLDKTGSMSGAKMDNLKIAAKALVDEVLVNLVDATASDQDKVRINMIGYSTTDCDPGSYSNNFVQTGFINDPTILKTEIDNLNPSGCTNGSPAAQLAKNEILSPPMPEGALKVFVFMTDGIFNRPESNPYYGFNNACSALETAGVIRYTIRFGGDGNLSALKDCASDDKADHFFDAPDPADIQAVFSQIASDLGELRVKLTK